MQLFNASFYEFPIPFPFMIVDRCSSRWFLLICFRKKKKEAREHRANGMVVIAQSDALRGAAVPIADEEGDTISTGSGMSRCRQGRNVGLF